MTEGTSVEPLSVRFWERVDRQGPSDCWLWLGPLDRDGYGALTHARKKLRAPRAAYQIAVGVIPEGLVLDHLCRVRACVNPSHLEPVTVRENIRRGYVGKANRHLIVDGQECCHRGHPWNVETTRMRPNGYLECILCGVERGRIHRAARSAPRQIGS